MYASEPPSEPDTARLDGVLQYRAHGVSIRRKPLDDAGRRCSSCPSGTHAGCPLPLSPPAARCARTFVDPGEPESVAEPRCGIDRQYGRSSSAACTPEASAASARRLAYASFAYEQDEALAVPQCPRACSSSVPRDCLEQAATVRGTHGQSFEQIRQYDGRALGLAISSSNASCRSRRAMYRRASEEPEWLRSQSVCSAPARSG